MARHSLQQFGRASVPTLLLLVSALLGACAWPTDVDWELLMLSTVTPAEPTATPAPLNQATIEAAPNLFDTRPTAFPSPMTPMPRERLAILEPGPGSFVRSGFRVVGRGGPTRDGKVRIRLIGENGGVLTRRIAYLVVPPGQTGRFYASIPFRIKLTAAAGRLEVGTFDRRDGEIDHITTVDLTLLSIGSSLIHPTSRNTEKLVILSPVEEQTVRKGVARVKGTAEVTSSLPLIIEVHDARGEVVGSIEVPTAPVPLGHFITFDIEVPYRIPHRQAGRIGVRQMSPRIPGTLHYNSVRVWLEP